MFRSDSGARGDTFSHCDGATQLNAACLSLGPMTTALRSDAIHTKPRLDWFLWGLLAALLLAFISPRLGSREGPLLPELTSRVGVFLVFLLHGSSLSLKQLSQGALKWRQHFVALGTSFVLMPLLGLGLVASGAVRHELGLGFFYLCALPSTVSSAVVLTSMARGNVAIAVFGTTVSSLLSVVVTPTWLAIDARGSGVGFELRDVLLELALLLLLPLTAGQLARPLFLRVQRWDAKRQLTGFRGVFVHVLSVLDRLVVIFIVYTAFCDSFEHRVWAKFAVLDLLLTLGTSTLLLLFVLLFVQLSSALLRFIHEERSAVAFVGATKSLALGAPMASVLFGERVALGPLLLPLLIYHPLQLVVCGFLANRWARALRGAGSASDKED